MRILHIWDICNNSQYLTEKINILGHKSILVTRKKMTIRLYRFILMVIFQLLTFRADIIHINAWDKGVLLAKILSPRSKIIMHYHGSNIRGKQIPFFVELFTNRIVVSTRDLIEPCHGNIGLLQVIVTNNFYYRGGRTKNKALYVHHYADYAKKAADYAKKNNLDLVVLDRMANPPIIVAHSLMPQLLSTIDYYLDFKGYTNFKTLTLTAKEAIACGCKVVVDNLDIVEDFEQTTIKDYIEVYNELIN